MIKFYGDITTVSGKSVIIHGVNCQNVMGSGVAKDIYTKWPEVKAQYHEYCVEEEYKKCSMLGKIQLIRSYPPLLICNLFSQKEYGYDNDTYADPTAIFDGLDTLFKWLNEDHPSYKDIYMPRIGCGLGGLNFAKDVLPMLMALDDKYDFNIYICTIKGGQHAGKNTSTNPLSPGYRHS